jgi:hypothetical protein
MLQTVDAVSAKEHTTSNVKEFFFASRTWMMVMVVVLIVLFSFPLLLVTVGVFISMYDNAARYGDNK